MNDPFPAREILVTGTSTVPPEALDLLRDRGFRIRAVPRELDDEALHDALDGVHGYIIGGYEEPTAAHFEKASVLEAVAWVGTDFRGYVPGWRRAFELGIAFVSTPGENAVSVAEFTISLLLRMARPLPVGDADPMPGTELRDLTIGLIGAGRIGSHVARLATLGLGMHAVYTAPRRNEALEAALGITRLSLPELLDRSDVVSLHRPGPRLEEAPLLGRPELERLRPGALLINTGHPDLVDPAALGWAVEQRQVRAAFDGRSKLPGWEPLALLDPDRCLVVQQMGFLTGAAGLRAGLGAAEGLCDVLSGMASPRVSNPDFLERRARAASA